MKKIVLAALVAGVSLSSFGVAAKADMVDRMEHHRMERHMMHHRMMHHRMERHRMMRHMMHHDHM